MNKKAFTLLEVLIVIIIIGILAAIALPQYTKTLEKANAAEAISQLGILRKSMERHWYNQLGLGTYTSLIELNNLDVDNPQDRFAEGTMKWSYSVIDKSTLTSKSYIFSAMRWKDSYDPTYWIQINQDGEIRKSEALGGSGIRFGAE